MLSIYKDKTVLVTGHTGFKGSWLTIWLVELGAKVIGYALDPEDANSNFTLSKVSNKITDIRGDINNSKMLEEVIVKYQPDFIFHLAAQPLVRESFLHPQNTFITNIIGTINVLEPLKKLTKKVAAIMITTDKVYENKETGNPFVESDPLGGYDPYSASKACAEIAISSYRNSFFNIEKIKEHQKYVASVRAGNVIGGGDWSKDRLIPDCIRSLEAKKEILTRNPHSIRPWQHVLEACYGYLLLGIKLFNEDTECCTSYNFGPDSSSVVEVIKIIEEIVKDFKGSNIKDISSSNELHEAKYLLLNSSKAKKELGWRDIYNYQEAIRETVEWYKNYKKINVYDFDVQQINNYMKKVNS